MDIVEFLQARLDEDEQEARDEGADAMIGHRWKHLPETDYNAIQHATLARCRRVLREVEAKRAIIEQADEATGLDAQVDGEFRVGPRDMDAEPYCGDVILRAIAAIYADHPDYDPDWR